MSTKVAKEVMLTAMFYGKELEDEQIKMFVELFNDFPKEAVVQAYKLYRSDSKNKFMPYPAQIIGLLDPELEPEEEARLIAGRITESITKFGWCSSSKAREYIGEIGWSVVESWGGWVYICENHGMKINPSTFYAQIRDASRSRLVHKTKGEMQGLLSHLTERQSLNGKTEVEERRNVAKQVLREAKSSDDLTDADLIQKVKARAKDLNGV